MPSITELVLLIVIIALIFGLGKLPTLGKQLAHAKKEFKEGLETGETEIKPPAVHLKNEDEAQTRFDGPKPGTRKPGIEDAELEEPS